MGSKMIGRRLPSPQGGINRNQVEFPVGALPKRFLAGAVEALDAAVEVWGPGRQHEEGNIVGGTGLLEVGPELTPPLAWVARIRRE
jgi:hypothetical protein